MKKFLFMFLSVILIFAACTKLDVMYDRDNVKDNVEIVFNSNVGHAPMTKAIVDGTSFTNNTYFGVYGYIKPTTNITNNLIMSNAKYYAGHSNNDSIGTPTDGKKYYWPMSDNLDDVNIKFVAYYPYEANSSNKIELSGTNFIYHITASDMNDPQDILYAITNNVTPSMYKNHPGVDYINQQKVPLVFHHALSLVQFQAKKADYSEDGCTLDIKINYIKFNSKINTTGDIKINLNEKAQNSDTIISLKNVGTDVEMNFASQNNDYNKLDNTYKILSTPVIIPQDVPDSVTVDFDVKIQNANGDEIIYAHRQVKRAVNTGNDDNGKQYIDTWASGHKYIYRLYFTADDVNFSISVDNWDLDWWQIWDYDNTTAYVEHFFDKASTIMENCIEVQNHILV